MILASAAGWALQTFAALDGGLLIGVVAGFVLAQLVPRKTSCPIRGPQHQES